MKRELMELLGVGEYFKLNAALQKKKQSLRITLKEKGILQKDKENKFDNYKYFSEAGYKQLFTALFSECGLELTTTEVDYQTYQTTSEKQPNGRLAKLKFTLTDCDTGFFEESEITGDGVDKGDKAGYKAYTGALKYYLANTFMVATGDDAENESPDGKGSKPNSVSKKDDSKASPRQIEILSGVYKGDNLSKLLQANGIQKLEDLPLTKASELIGKLYGEKGV